MPSHFTFSLSKPQHWVSMPLSIQYNCCAEVTGIKLHALSWFQLHVSNCLSMVLRLLKHRGQNVPCPSPYAHKLSSGAKLSITLSDSQSRRLGTFPFPVSRQLLNPSSSHKILLTVFHAFVNALIKVFKISLKYHQFHLKWFSSLQQPP